MDHAAIGSEIHGGLCSIQNRYVADIPSDSQAIDYVSILDGDSFIQNQIELICSTQALAITDQFMTAKVSRPLFKSLHFQSNLTMIDLSNSFIQDDGIKHLAQALPTLAQLTVLNLSGNSITTNGIKHLSAIFDFHTEALMELKALHLNFNPLQNQSLTSLSKFCRHLPQLTTLHLTSTELTNLQDFDLNFNTLTDLDLSFNIFQPDGLTAAIEKLNACKLIRINFAFCLPVEDTSNSSFIEALTKTLSSGTCVNFKEIRLDGCGMTDIDCWRVLQPVSRSKVLQCLSLRENAALTKVTWKYLLENFSVKEMHLEGCPKMIAGFRETDLDSIFAGHQSENITISLSNEIPEKEQVNLLEKVWATMSKSRGRLVRNGTKVLMTLRTDPGMNDWTNGL